MEDWVVVGPDAFSRYRPRTAEAIEEILKRTDPSVRFWASRELKKQRVPADDYEAILPTLGRIASRITPQALGYMTWEQAKVALNNWVYLNGQVAFSDRPFEGLRGLAEREGNQEAKALANHWLVGNNIIPAGHKDAIATGEMTNDGHVLILNTNADRNAVRDAVLTRTGSVRWSAWNMDFSRNNMPHVANEYEALKTRRPTSEEIAAWHKLAAENAAHANYIRQHLNVQVTDEDEPYPDAHTMINDIKQNRNFVVSRANSEHPIWTPEQNVDFRTVHDVFGHAASGGDFGWDGENHACSTHHALSSPEAAKALTTECLGQTGWAIHNGGFGDQHIGFMPVTHSRLLQSNQGAPPATREQLMQMALTPRGRVAAPVGPIQPSPYGPSNWSPQGQQKLFTLGIGNTTADEFMSWVQQNAPSMIQFMRITDGTGLFEGSPETSVAVRVFDTPLPKVKQFLDFYGKSHPQEWGFGLEWGNGSTVYQNKFNDGSVAEGNLEGDDWTQVRETSSTPRLNNYTRKDDWQPVRTGAADLNGSMVSLDVPPEYHGQLAVRGGEKPKNLHLTLAYLPEGIKDESGVASMLNDIATKMKPVRGTIKKLDAFPKTKDGDIPQIAHIEGDDIHSLQQAVAAGLKGLGENVSEKYDFNPHVTLKYTQPDEEFEHPNPDIKGMELHFPAVHLHQGGDIQEFQLGKSPVTARNDWEEVGRS